MTGEAGLRILLVEDNPGDARLLREAFGSGRSEHALDVVEDGEEALSHLRDTGATAPLPDLILLDLKLPGIDGGEVLAEVKGDSRLRTIPVLVLTSSDEEEDVVRSYEHDANAYMTKPTDPEEYVDLVRTVEEFWHDFAKLPPERGSR